MQQPEAEELLRRYERRMRPARAPFTKDEEIFNDWVQLLVEYHKDDVHDAWRAHREKETERWPDWYAFRDLLERASSQQRHPSNTDAEGCQACNGSGWAAATEPGGMPAMFQANVIHDNSDFELVDATTQQKRKRTTMPARHTYTWAEPCRCPAGQQAERTDLWRKAPRLCHACKGAGWFNHQPDEVERCTNCGGSGIERP